MLRQLVLAAALWPVSCAIALASGNAIARFGGEHGTVNDTNPTAFYYNPGALGFSEHTQLFVDGQLAIRSLQWTHAPGQGDVIPPLGYESATFGTARALNVFGGPMLGASFKLGRLVVGAALYAPFGGSVAFDRREVFTNSAYPGAADGVARWHGIEASTMSIYGTIGAAYRIGPLSVGVTGNLVYTTLRLYRAQNLDDSNNLDGEGRGRLDVAGVHGSFGAGVMYEAVARTLWLAASYQAQPGLGSMTLDGTLEVDATVPRNEETLTRNVSLHQALPDIWRVGARWRAAPTWELRFAADLTRWSVQRTQCVAVRGLPCHVTPSGDATPDSGAVRNLRRHWRDAVGLRVGGSVWIVPTLELFAGLGFETAATPDETVDPVLVDAPSITAAIGGRWELAPTWYIQAQYSQLQFFPRDNTGRSRLADPGVGQVTHAPDAGGQYRQWVAILNANVQKTF